MMYSTYSPEDNKLRLYATERLDSATYERVRAAGFIYAPKQGLFVAPMWTPQRAALLIELCGEIGDEDTSLVQRAEERAERFEDYADHRQADASAAHAAVSAIADNIPLGQPILVGHHSERHARKDAERIETGMRKAVKMWETSKYWTDRAAGAIRAAKYKERPDVRARRIKKLEAELRKYERERKQAAGILAFWQRPDISHAQAVQFCNFYDHAHFCFTLADYPRNPPVSQYEGMMGLWSALGGSDGESHAIITIEQARQLSIDLRTRSIAHYDEWIGHTQNRLGYERAMLQEQGGTVADRTGPEVGGACRCWASPGYGQGWSYIVKVNKVSVTIRRGAEFGIRVFSQTMEFDKLKAVLSRVQVEEYRAAGKLQETPDKAGFYLMENPQQANAKPE